MATTESKELQLGACYGRYRGWKSVGETAQEAPAVPDVASPEELPTEEQPTPEPQTVPPPGAIVVQFEATAREDFRIGFAPPRVGKEHSQWVYEVAVGFSGNTEVVWRKNVANPTGGSSVKEVDLAQVFAGRTCSLQEFVPYWIVVQQGVLVFGIGAHVGVDTIAKCVDASFVQVQQVALTTWDTPATFRNIVLTPVYDAPLDVASMVPGTIVRADPSGNVDLVTPQERDEFQKAYESAKRRAERFGGEFVPPSIKTFIDPKTVRKLQRTGAVQPGFATGFDLTSQDEVSKREQRMKRFNTPEFAVEYSTETVRALSEGLTQEEWQEKQREKEKLRERALKFGLPVDQDGGGKMGMDLQPANGKVGSERCDIRGDTMVEFRDDAIHVYSLDDRFQQVRTNDILEYFVGYGPSYVEWINDSSCTVVFEDPFTAGRALISLSQEVPPQTKKLKTEVPAPSDVKQESAPASSTTDDVDMDGGDAASGESSEAQAASMEAAATQVVITEVPDEDFNRSSWRYGAVIGSSTQPSHKKWRMLLRRATEDDFPAEKTNKKYHDRSRISGRQLQQRGRGHRQQQQDKSEMPSRYPSSSGSSRRSGGRARAHPYQGGGRRRERRQSGDFDDDDSREDRNAGKPSNRIRVNEDGSINVVRSGEREVPIKTESGDAPPPSAEVKAEPSS